ILTATALGYAVGLSVKNPMVISLAGNVMLFFVLLFTPITFPARQLPAWLADLDRLLPFWHMGQLIRDTLTGAGSIAEPLLVTCVWAVAFIGLCWRASRIRD
ncbi:MAG: ABC transporter permease, partial [Mycobacteriales bacterium]